MKNEDWAGFYFARRLDLNQIVQDENAKRFNSKQASEKGKDSQKESEQN